MTRPISPTDSAWLSMDTPENLMVIETVMWFHGPLDIERVKHALQTRLVDRYPVFRSVAKPSGLPVGLGSWVDDPEFSLDRQIVQATLGAPYGREALRHYMEARMSEPLPMDRPLWQCHLLDDGHGFSAMITRFHHAVADGTALIRVLLDLTTELPDDDLLPRPLPGRAQASPGSGPESGSTGRVDSILRLPTAISSTFGPAKIAGLAARAARITAEMPGIAEKFVSVRQPDLPFFGQAGVAKGAAWSDPFHLAPAKTAAKARGGTINDLVIAALGGTLRRYLLTHDVKPQDVITMVPVNLRSADSPLPDYLGNKFALVAAKLPVAAETPEARFAAAKSRMDAIKRGPESMLTFGVNNAIGVIGAVSATGSRSLVDYFSNLAIGVTTNVPGPRVPLYFAGTKVDGLLGWVPGARNQSVGVSILSYNDELHVGWKTDRTLLPDGDYLPAFFAEEMAELISG